MRHNSPPHRRLGTVAAAAAVALAALAGGPAQAADADQGRQQAADHKVDRKEGRKVPHGWIVSRIRHMTLEEKVGQLFVTYAYGDSVDANDSASVAANQSTFGVDNAEQLIDKYKLGGIIYFAWSGNVDDPEQIAELSNGIQRVAMDQRASIPMLVSTDQEYGVVTRVGPPATQFPGSMALGAGRSVKDAYTAGAIGGEELRAVGVNQDFAPIADVNVNALNPVIGVRSFGEDPQMVAEMVAAQVNGYQENVVSTAKHFPGHGDTDVDSHTGIPVITHTREEWERIDLPPFQAAIEQGIGSIMTAHIVVPSLDPSGDPATLSKPIMTGILREELGYDGVVITDALTMAGVREKYGDDRVPVLALKAGVDQLLMPPDLDLAYNSVLDAVRSGELTEKRIDESVYRVLRLKFERGLFRDPYVNVDRVDEVVGAPEHLAAAQDITDRTVTLVKNEDDQLPLEADSGQDVLVTGWGTSTTATLADRMAERGVDVEALATGSGPSDAEISAAVTAAGDHELTVVTTYRAWTDVRQQVLVEKLVATGKPIIVAAVRDPYDIAYFTGAPTYLATYSTTSISMESLARVLFGEVNPTGKLPVTIPVAGNPDRPLYDYGYGLSYDG